MKKNCKGCIALQKKNFDAQCILMHPITPLKEINHTLTHFKPLEECAKPKTFEALCRILRK